MRPPPKSSRFSPRPFASILLHLRLLLPFLPPPLSLSIWIPKSRLEMPAWWPSKSKSKAKSKSTPRKSNPKEELKASSFDGVSVTRTPPRELSPAGGGAVAPLFSLGYRLPLPCELASASSLQTHDQAGVLVTGSISASSSTSYASSDENPELGFLRYFTVLHDFCLTPKFVALLFRWNANFRGFDFHSSGFPYFHGFHSYFL